VFVCVFLSWFSAICAYNIFVDILYTNIKVIERVRSKYRIAEYNIGINIPSLTIRILVP
jgi:general stress protein CsbA